MDVSRVLRPNYAQRYLLPPSPEDWVSQDHPVRFVRDFVDALDLADFGIKEPKSGDVGRPAYEPAMLLKVWLFGYMSRIRSCRKLEKACFESMPFLWLTTMLHPDHNSLWRFFDVNRSAFPKLFRLLTRAAAEAGLVGSVLHALDGTKVTAVSSTDTAQHKKALAEKLEHLDEFIKAYVAAVLANATVGNDYKMPAAMKDESARRAKIREMLQRRIEDRADEQGDEPKEPAKPADESEPARDAAAQKSNDAEPAKPADESATARDEAAQKSNDAEPVKPADESEPARDAAAQKSNDAEPVKPADETAPAGEKKAALLSEQLPEGEAKQLVQEAEALAQETKSKLAMLAEAGVNHLHAREPEARMMKGRGTHALGYNAQIVVDHDSDMIVACDVVTQQNDLAQLTPMLEQVHETLGRVAEQTVADGGYASGEQFKQAEERDLPVLVSLRDEPEAKGEYSKAHFQYDAVTNEYVCPRGERLIQVGLNKSHATQQHPDVIYRCNNTSCPVREQCSKEARGRKIRRPYGEDARERQAAKQQDPRMGILLGLRKEIVEHLFGIVKTIDGFRRFTVRGLEKVKAQWSLVCLAVNLRKLAAMATWVDGRLVPRALAERAAAGT